MHFNEFARKPNVGPQEIKNEDSRFMKTLTTTEELAQFCEEARQHPYVTIDTEFLRERTYYSKLCLVQMAYPGEGDENAVLVDPLVDGLSL